MRVLSIGSVYPPHHLGGYEVIWRGVSRALLDAGDASRVLVTDHRNPDVTDADDADVRRELRWYWRDHGWPKFSLAQAHAVERHNATVLGRQLEQFRPDVVAFWALGGMSLSLIEQVRGRGIPAVFFVLDPWPSYGPRHDRWLATWRHLGPAAAVVTAATGIPARLELDHGRWLFCSRSMLDQTLADGITVAPERRALLAPGVDGVYLSAPAETEPPPWRFRLLYLGRVVEQKGVLTAVEALAHLPAEATLAIVGDGDPAYRARLESRVRELGLTGRVSFTATVSQADTVATYRAADVVLHPVNWAEPWGLVPLEAMALGRPVVATGRGGSADFLADGVNALLHRADDAPALAAAVRRLAADPGLRARLTAAGRETAESHSAAAFNLAARAELARAAEQAGAVRS